MTDNELNLLVENVKWVLRYDDCNPDVGWGMSPESALQTVCQATNINLSVREVATVIGLYNMRHGRRR